jgi:hypothetical protein
VVSTAREAHINNSLIHALKNMGYSGRIAITAHIGADKSDELAQANADLVMMPYADVHARWPSACYSSLLR